MVYISWLGIVKRALFHSLSTIDGILSTVYSVSVNFCVPAKLRLNLKGKIDTKPAPENTLTAIGGHGYRRQ
jgi:hypothetical protein